MVLQTRASLMLSAFGTATTAPQKVHPDSFYWNMRTAGDNEAVAGFGFYTRIFSLFEEGKPLDMQMGMGGTWLTPTNITWGVGMGDTCACDPNGWPSTTPGDGRFGCCESDGRCGDLYETFEGGPGYWIGQLPTKTPKWRVNSAVGCYRDQTSTPLFNFGQAGQPHPCESMGIAQLSNRMLMAPDGLTFEDGKQGMVGVAYVRTPLGKITPDDDRNFWTIVVDTVNFAGPLGYFIPEFWAERWDSPNPSPGSAALPDLGKHGHGLAMGGGAFEWAEVYNYKSDDGYYKVPAMKLPLGNDGQTTLFKDALGYEDAEIFDPLSAALEPDGKLDPEKLMVGGKSINCVNGSAPATYRLDGTHAEPGNYLINVGTLNTLVDDDGNCRWTFTPNTTLGDSADGHLPQYFSPDLKPIDEADAPADLVAQQFEPKADMGPYDGLSHPPAGECATNPGPADDKLYCAQTTSPSWVAFRWFKFVEQPAFGRAKLSAEEKSYLQSRVEKMHRMLNEGGLDAGKWMKQHGEVEGLATVDAAQLVTPPKGLEVGYVPVVMYEGTAKPDGCADFIV